MPAGPERGQGTTGLVIALPAEARSLGVRGTRTGDCTPWRGGWVAVCGIGPHNAMRAAERLVSHGATRLASWGVAGALDPSLAPGDIVVPEQIVYSATDEGCRCDAAAGTFIAGALAEHLRVHRGILWSTHQAIARSDEKRALAARSQACIVDMEAAPVAVVARRHGLPFVAVKAVCDSAGRDLPQGIAGTLEQSDSGVSLRMLGAIAIGGPRAWHATGKLAGDFARARRALATASRLVDPMAWTA